MRAQIGRVYLINSYQLYNMLAIIHVFHALFIIIVVYNIWIIRVRVRVRVIACDCV